MPRLIPCPSCHSHVLVGDRECPSCGTVLRTTTAPRVAGVLALGLALTGCPGDGDDDTAGTSATTTGTNTSTATTEVGTSTTADSVTGTGGVDYGTAEFGDELTTGTETEGTTGTSSEPEPEYGVPATGTTGTEGTTSLGEPEYGVPETTSTG